MKKLIALILFLSIWIGITSATIISYPEQVQEHLQYINEYRETRGLTKLIYHTWLSQCIENYLKDQINNNYVWHIWLNGSMPKDRCSYVLNTDVWENLIASSYLPWAKTALVWRANSPTHKANMVDYRYKYIGIAAVYDDNLKRARRWQLFSRDTDYMWWTTPPTVNPNNSLYDNIYWSWNIQQNQNKPDMLYRNIVKISNVRSWGKRYLRLYLTLDRDIDRWKTSLMSSSIVKTLARIFEPL